MNPELSADLEKYSQVAKEGLNLGKKVQSGEIEIPDAQITLNDLNMQIEDYIANRVSSFNTTEQAQAAIYRLQLEKQKIMDRLHEDLCHLNDEQYVNERFPQSRNVKTENGQLFIETINQRVPVTPGEIYTDIEWGIRYNLTDKEIPHLVKKRYLLETAKLELRYLLDKQIYRFETSKRYIHYMKHMAYEAVMDEKSKKLQAGHVMEKIIRNFFKKLEFDSSLNFEIIDTNLYQDIEQKIDFIIRRKQHFRGVRTEAVEATQSHGIQFTTNTNPEVLGHKIKQIERVKNRLEKAKQEVGPSEVVEDLVLIQMPSELSHQILEIFHNWKKDKNPGGPDKLLSPDIKEKIFRNILNGIISAEEVDEQWMGIKGRAQEGEITA